MVCPQCNNQLIPAGSFCSECGFRIETVSLSGVPTLSDDISLNAAGKEMFQTLDKAMTLEAKVERYETREQLSTSSSGTVVFKALDRRLERLVVIMRFQNKTTTTMESCHKIFDRARAISCLSHENIARIHEVGEDADGLFVVMENIDGQNLEKLLDSCPMTPERTVEIGIQLCGALSLFHSKGLIFGHITPRNILIDNRGVPKLVELGLSSDFSSDFSEQSSSQQHARPVSFHARNDIYSLGATIYHMLTGHPLSVLQPELIPEDLRSCVLRALETEPERCYKSPEECAASLAEALTGDPNSLLRKANDLFKAGDLERALLFYNRFLRHSPNNTWARQNSALIEEKIKTIGTARREANEAAASSKWNDAARLWKRVLQHAPNDTEAGEQLARIQEEIRNARLGPTLMEAGQLLVAGYFDQVQELCLTALELDPGNQEAIGLQKAANDGLLKEARAKIVSATQAYQSRDYASTMKYLQEALLLLPEGYQDRQRFEKILTISQICHSIEQCDLAIQEGRIRDAERIVIDAEALAALNPKLLARVQKRRSQVKELLAKAEQAIQQEAQGEYRRAYLMYILKRSAMVCLALTCVVIMFIALKRAHLIQWPAYQGPGVVSIADADVGQAIQGSGTLESILSRDGETHLLLGRSPLGTGESFEVFTKAASFPDALAVLVSSLEKRDEPGDFITILGSLRDSDDASFRLDTNRKLVELTKVECSQPQVSVAADEQKTSFGQNQEVAPSVLRQLGNHTFQAYYQEFANGCIRLSATQQEPWRRRGISIPLPQGHQSFFSDYRDGNEVEVNATREPAGLIMKRIVRLKNRLSLVTDQGRKVPPVDFTREKEIWGINQSGNIEPHRQHIVAGNRYVLGGVYAGTRAKGLRHTIDFEDLFFTRPKYSSEKLKISTFCDLSGSAQESLEQFLPGDELLFEILAPDASSDARETADRSNSRFLIYQLCWIARITEPQRRVVLTP